MDAILEAAQTRRAELAEELKKIDIFLETYRSLEIELKLDESNKAETNISSTGITLVGVGGTASEAAREAGQTDAAPAKRVRVRDNPKPADVVKAALEVIEGAGRPMSRREIHVALKERGMEVKGSDPIKTLGTTLWRSGQNQLVQIEGEGYWPKWRNWGDKYKAPWGLDMTPSTYTLDNL